jgi:hypothetical protein
MISRDPDGVAKWFERFFGSKVVAEQFPAGARNLVLRVGEGTLSVRTPRPSDGLTEADGPRLSLLKTHRS